MEIVKLLVISVFHEITVPRFGSQKMEHLRFFKRSEVRKFHFFFGNQKNGTPHLLQAKGAN